MIAPNSKSQDAHGDLYIDAGDSLNFGEYN